ncbi:hypothetical protein QAD02_011205 [Eretmocerus hayati]|uniref:Uncharacterized protein n=1 Tax=Eretmocerus hayati TaxID=131215 RepID=A0ACC2NWH2_9HYME|nr:hypothetical protein QAD02_011205 [Eretmocerus hayati]
MPRTKVHVSQNSSGQNNVDKISNFSANSDDFDKNSLKFVKGDCDNGKSESVVRLRKEIGLLDAVAIIVGVIVGSGIFVTPQGVLEHSHSTTQALFVWVFSGFLSLIGALCYAELGTMILKSGGAYAYIKEAFGPLPAFLYLWVALFILIPSGNAVAAITFARYILQAVWPNCAPPYAAERLLAAVVICFLTAVNCRKVKWATTVQDIFTGTKVFALAVIIAAGLWYLCLGHTENFHNTTSSSSWQLRHFALSMYSGLFSYSGWNYLTFVTEELKDPYKNLPRAICISLPLVTVIYVFANVAYFTVLTRHEILSSNAVAVTFEEKLGVLGPFSWLIPFFVACSTFGGLNGSIFACSRLLFVGARNGHLPAAISLINVKNLTPMPSLIFLCIITLGLILIENIYSLINCGTFIDSVFATIAIGGLLWLRYKKPDLPKPIKVPILLPIVFFIICAFLLCVPLFSDDLSNWEIFVGIAFALVGVPVYYIFIEWTGKPRWIVICSREINTLCSKTFLCVQEDEVGGDDREEMKN